MATNDQQLVQLITAKVMDALREQGLIGESQAHASSEPRTNVQPPIGICTGDYSKFPELAGRITTPPPTDSASSAPTLGRQPSNPATAAPTMPTMALTGVVTASRLQEAMDAAPDGVAVLATDARLSPMANDLVRQFPKRIRRAVAGDASTTVAGHALPWLTWVQGHCAIVNQVLAGHVGRFVGTSATHHAGALGQVVRDLSSSVKSHRVAGGLLFVPSAARAMCYLNRCSSIRAVVATCGEAVEQGVNELGANALVIEYPHHGHRAMAAMVERMLQSTPTAPTQVQRDLADLQRC